MKSIDTELFSHIVEQMPSLGSTAGEQDPIAWLRFYTPEYWVRWYGIEHWGENMFLGLAIQEVSPVTFDLSKLVEYEKNADLKVEWDRDFKPCRLSELIRNQK